MLRSTIAARIAVSDFGEADEARGADNASSFDNGSRVDSRRKTAEVEANRGKVGRAHTRAKATEDPIMQMSTLAWVYTKGVALLVFQNWIIIIIVAGVFVMFLIFLLPYTASPSTSRPRTHHAPRGTLIHGGNRKPGGVVERRATASAVPVGHLDEVGYLADKLGGTFLEYPRGEGTCSLSLKSGTSQWSRC